MEQRYKETPIGKIPEGWEVVRLGDKGIAEIRGSKSVNNVEKVAFIPMELIPDSNIYVKYETRNFREVKSSTYCEAGDLLLAKITPSLENGKQGIVPENVPNGFALATTEVFPIACIGVDKFFLFYILKHPKFRKILEYSMRGTTGRQRVPKEAVENLLIPLPPLPEQRKIAEILSTVDKAIEKVDEAIAKTERLKKGLMQELLTKGIGHTEFRDTEIGRIPKEWEVVKLEDVCVKITDGSHWSPKEVEKSEYRIATVANLRDRYIDINSCKPISKKDFEKLLREGDVPEKGDILFSKDGTVGICFSFNQDESKVALLSSIAIIKPKKQVLDSEFGAYILKAPKIFWQISGKKTGTALTRVILKELKTIKIPLPPLPEQQKIAEILSTVDKKLELERERKEKLERIRKGLMNDLLTGRRRVKV